MMGNTSSSHKNEIPTVENIFKYGPQFDHAMRMKLDSKQIIFPFQNNKEWTTIVQILNEPDDSDTCEAKISHLQNIFKSLSNHSGYKFIQYLKSFISVKKQSEKKDLIVTFLTKTLPFIKQLILKMPELFTKDHNLEYMQPKIDKMIKLTRIQTASILACCFFDLMANHCCFSDELRSKGVPGKFDSYINYFEYVHLKGFDSNWSKEDIIIYRRCLKAEKCSFLEHKNLLKNSTKLCDFVVYEKSKKRQQFKSKQNKNNQKEVKQNNDTEESNDKQVNTEQKMTEQNENDAKDADNIVDTNEEKEAAIVNERIEDCMDGIHADFANQFIGGGVLNGGNVQEEIRFTVNTECIVSKLLCPQPMENDEAIIIFKSQQFCGYEGYGCRFKCTGLINREIERNKSVIVGIDAVNFFSRKKQYELRYLMRELCKAYIGFSIDTETIIEQRLDVTATGNWGCGMFGGNPQLKSMIQWIAITLSNRNVAYYTFNDKRVENRLKNIVEIMMEKEITIGQLWKILNCKRFDETHDDVFDIIEKRI